MRFNFKAEILVKLNMENSKLEKLWEGAQPLRSLKKIRLDGSTELKEIPNLSNAINLEKLNLSGCTSLVTLPSSIQKLSKLRKLSMEECTKLKVLPTEIDLGCLDYLNLSGCSRLRSFPRISRNISGLILDGTAIEEEDSVYLENISGLTKLDWNGCPMKCLPPGFRPENLVYLTMRGSKLVKLWEGIQSLGSLVRMDLSGSENLKEFPDLSTAINLDHLELNDCKSLVMLPSSIRNLNRLTRLEMQGCTKLKFLPTNVYLESLEYLDLRGCSSLRSFPRISRNISELHLNGTAIEDDKDCFFIGDISGLTELIWSNCPMKYLPSNFRAEHLIELAMPCSKLEKLWEGIQSLGGLKRMDLSGCESLKGIPNLSKATNLEYLNLSNCKNLVMLPPTIRNLKKLVTLNMEGCTGLKFLPNDVNLVSLNPFFNLSGCSRLRSFPRISTSITSLSLDLTAITEVPSWIENMSSLTSLTMKSCKKLKKVASNSFKLKRLLVVDYSDCERVTCFGDASAETHTTESQLPVTKEASFHPSYLIVCAKNCKSLQSISHYFLNPMSCLKFHNCFKLDRDARELILQSDFKYAVLPGGEVPTYFRHRAYGSSLTISLCKSSLSQKVLRFKACIMLDLLTLPEDHSAKITVQWYFRGKSNIHHVEIDVDSCQVDHLVVFHFELCLSKEVDGHPYKFDYDDVEFKFEYHNNACSCKRCSPIHYNKQTCPLPLQKIKGCGVRLLNVSPSKDGSGKSSETEYNQQYGDSDIESG